MVNHQWLQTRINLLRRSKQRVQHLLGPEPPEITQYAEEYKRELKRPWRKSDLTELLAAIQHSQIVYGADFHGHAQAQRTHLRILRRLQGQPVTLALEVLAISDQAVIDQYFYGKIRENDFLERIHWHERWGVPFEHYRPFFALAQQNHWRVIGLDSRQVGEEKDLETRDREAAERLRALHLQNQGTPSLIYTIFGDLHMAEKHLPQKVANLFEVPPRKVIVFQNAESIYFALLKRGLEASVDLVAMGEEKFCVMTSPPWVQWQSYLMYLENALDVSLADEEEYAEGDAEEGEEGPAAENGDFDRHVYDDHDVRNLSGEEDEEDEEDDEDDDGDDDDGDDDAANGPAVDYTDYVAQYAQILAADFAVRVDLSQLSVFSANEENVWGYLEESLGGPQLEIAAQLMEKDRSFFVPSAGLFYLSRASVNHAAYLAALFLYGQLSGVKRCLWTFPDDFLRLIWQESFAFFMSKMINHKRIAVTLVDIQRQLSSIREGETREILQLVVEQRMSDVVYLQTGQARVLTFCPSEPAVYIEAARLLGAICGERIYVGVREGQLTSRDILGWMKTPLDDAGFQRAYFNLISRIESFALSYKKEDRV